MMEHIFLKLLNMSISAGWLILAVVLLRCLLKKARKSVRVVLWAMVGFRLICPFSLESALSLIPSAETIPQTIPYARQPAIDSGIAIVDQQVNPVLARNFSPVWYSTDTPMLSLTQMAGLVWVVGMVAMLLYMLLSYLRLRLKVRVSIEESPGIFLCDEIQTPFILGLFRPRIYLPSALNQEHRVYVVAHERAHLKRRDHWWKPLGFLLLAVYWFNPLVWVAYVLLCRDIELACDERVVQDLEPEYKKAYSEALLSCSLPRRAVTACPLAFGETRVKGRIRAVLRQKKPALWLSALAVLICILVAVLFLTDPKDQAEQDEQTAPTTATDQSNGLLGQIQDSQRFVAMVQEVTKDRLLVTPVADSPILATADQFWVSTAVTSTTYAVPAVVPGDLIQVVCFGTIAETYPAQINHVFAIFPVDENGEVIAGADWGIDVRILDPSPTGMRLVLDHSGGNATGTLIADQQYWLEKQTDGIWYPVQRQADVEEPPKTTEIPRGRGVLLEIDWTMGYGALPDGIYRIVMPIRDQRSTGDYDTQHYYGTFTLDSSEQSNTRVYAYSVTPYVGVLTMPDVSALPSIEMTTDKHIHTVDGVAYIEINPVTTWTTWHLNLSLLQPIGVIPDGTIAFSAEDSRTILLLADGEDTGDYRWLVMLESNILNILEHELPDYHIYLDGQLVEDSSEAETIWTYHTNPEFISPLLYLLDGDHWEYHWMTLICKAYPALFYEVGYSYYPGYEEPWVGNVAVQQRRESLPSYRSLYVGALPECNTDRLPSLEVSSSGSVYTINGQTYVIIPTGSHSTDSFWWYADISMMQPVGRDKDYAVLYSFAGNDDLIARAMPQSYYPSPLLMREGSGVFDITSYELSDFRVYIDGVLQENLAEAQIIWRYHIGGEPSPALQAEGGLHLQHRMVLVNKACPGLTYYLDYSYIPGYEEPCVVNLSLLAEQEGNNP